MRRCSIASGVALGALTLWVGVAAAGGTHYVSGRKGKAPYIDLTVARGRVTTVQWRLIEPCDQAYPLPGSGPTHLNARIGKRGRFSKSVDNGNGGVTKISGTLMGSTVVVTIDDDQNLPHYSPCEGKHTFHAKRR